MNAGQFIAGALFWLVAGLAYWLPTIIGKSRHVRNIMQIAVLNGFLGWTIVGWVAALVWALKPLERTA